MRLDFIKKDIFYHKNVEWGYILPRLLFFGFLVFWSKNQKTRAHIFKKPKKQSFQKWSAQKCSKKTLPSICTKLHRSKDLVESSSQTTLLTPTEVWTPLTDTLIFGNFGQKTLLKNDLTPLLTPLKKIEKNIFFRLVFWMELPKNKCSKTKIHKSIQLFESCSKTTSFTPLDDSIPFENWDTKPQNQLFDF